MHCPFCFAVDTKVIDSRLVGEVHPYAAVGSVWCVMNVSPPLKWRSWLCRVL